MKKYQKNQAADTLKFRTPDWFKGKFLKKELPRVKPISFRGTQHRG